VILYLAEKKKKINLILINEYCIRDLKGMILMKKPRIGFSNDRLQLNFDIMAGGKTLKRNMTIHHKDIESVTIEYWLEKAGLKDYESERIVIRTKKLYAPIIYYGIKEFNWYDNYKNGLRKFAVDNKIKLIDQVLT